MNVEALQTVFRKGKKKELTPKDSVTQVQKSKTADAVEKARVFSKEIAAVVDMKDRAKQSVEQKLASQTLKLVEDPNTVERYSLNEPYAYARIIRDPLRGTTSYVVEEPELTSVDQDHLKRLRGLLIEVLDVNLMKIDSRDAARRYLREKAEDVLNRYDFKISKEDKEKLLYYVIRDNMGYGKIDAVMRDPGIEDISCDGVGINVYVWHRKYEYVPTSIRFENSEELNSFALRLAYLCRSHVSIAQPILDSALPDGSRIHMTFGTEITRRGSTFAIRKFKTDPMTVIDLMDYGTISSELAAYFWYAVENRVSIMVSGGIAAGKTTMLNCLSMFIKPDMKIVSIEDTPEMNLPHQNWIPTTTRTHFGIGTDASDITLFDLLKASLRQRPDYIIVGEIRGDEAYTLFQAVGTGHLGMSTLHAESVEAAIYRLESEPMNVPRTLISGINMITVQKRVDYKDKPCRRTVSMSEIIGLDPRSREILTNDVYRWNPTNDSFDFSGRSYLVERIAQKKGISLEAAYEEIKRRTQILEGLSKRKIRNYIEVSDVIRRYYENPKTFLISEVMKGE